MYELLLLLVTRFVTGNVSEAQVHGGLVPASVPRQRRGVNRLWRWRPDAQRHCRWRLRRWRRQMRRWTRRTRRSQLPGRRVVVDPHAKVPRPSRATRPVVRHHYVVLRPVQVIVLTFYFYLKYSIWHFSKRTISSSSQWT